LIIRAGCPGADLFSKTLWRRIHVDAERVSPFDGDMKIAGPKNK
jgi:hypothetical protein